MEILQTITLILFAICCAVLIFLVMLQSGKGGGLNLVGGGNTGMQPATVDPVAKFTWIVGIIFFVLAILAAVFFADTGPGSIEDKGMNNDQQNLPLSQPQGNDTNDLDSKSIQKSPDNQGQ